MASEFQLGFMDVDRRRCIGLATSQQWEKVCFVFNFSSYRAILYSIVMACLFFLSSRVTKSPSFAV